MSRLRTMSLRLTERTVGTYFMSLARWILRPRTASPFVRDSNAPEKSSTIGHRESRRNLLKVGCWRLRRPTGTRPIFEDADQILNDALRQLTVAIALSIFLIFVTLMIQFGDAMNALLVLVAIPLGLIGVLASLYVFGSTLSLNSALGIILLNGIAVANSIILVDFQKKLVERGVSPQQAAAEAGRKRLRPILITSLSTILAILPVAQ